MKDLWPTLKPPALPALAGPSASALGIRPCRLALLLLAVCCAATVQAADPYADALDRRVADLESGIKQQESERAQGPQVAPQAPAGQGNFLWVAVVVLAATLAAQIGLQSLNRRFGQQAPANDALDNLLLEEHSILAFFEELRAGPITPPPRAAGVHPPAAANPLRNFLGWAPAEGAKLQNLFAQASRSNDTPTRQEALLELSERLRSLCYGCRVPELRPIWQLAFALEGLSKQLAGKPSDVTASVLQTIAGGLDVLHTVCGEGLTAQLATPAPARFLVVDDDAVSRFAVAASLKRAFEPPDLAPDANAGFALAAHQTYDVIFLDVEMPGMDGFELCKRIRQSAFNTTTPVVFVTRHSDFDSRAKAALSGGQYLLGKPFLALEITVKALTLVLRSRQQRSGPEPEPAKPREPGSAEKSGWSCSRIGVE